MLDTWLKVAYDQSRQEKAETDLYSTMARLPVEELYKLALGMAAKSCNPDRGIEWLDKFKGTSLFEQAIGLEQEGIQLEMACKQQSEMDRSTWDMRDQLGMKKRLLELQLAQMEQQQMTGAPPEPAAPGPAPAEPPPAAAAPASAIDPATGTPKSVTVKMGAADKKEEETPLAYRAGASIGTHLPQLTGLAGALGGTRMGLDVASHAGAGIPGHLLLGVGGGTAGFLAGRGAGRAAQGLASGLAHAPPEGVPVDGKEASAAVLESVAWARKLAQADRERIEDAVSMIGESVAMGQALAKGAAFNPAALLGQAKGLAGRAAGAAGGLVRREPAAAIGALAGGAGGLAAGLQKDEHGQRSIGRAVGGAVLGAGGGALGAHAGTNIAKSMANGTPMGAAVKHYASHWGDVLRGGAGRSAAMVPAG